MNTARLILNAGPLELEIDAATGGAIARFDHVSDGRIAPVLRRSPEPLRSVLQAASFPLVPFVNRIRDGAFSFRGRQVTLAPNMGGDPSPLHGHGWLNPWRTERSSGTEADLLFDHQPDEWPWSYHARQTFALDESGLTTTISCRNMSHEPMPCGLGIHPYFYCGPETRIRASVDHVWTVDEKVLPVAKEPATGRYDIGDSLVCGRNLDNGYGGWGGSALLTDPEWPFDVELSSPGVRFFQLYSPPQGGIFVVEPVTHANDALSRPEEEWADLGMRIIGPGETMELQARIDVRAK